MNTVKLTMAALTASITMSGCATVGETMAGKEPSAILQSVKSPAEFRTCIVSAQEAAALQITEHEGGFMFVSTKLAGQVFTVTSAPSGSTVTVWGLLGTRNMARQCL